ncbi:AhpC/TSA family protein [filamentous cyanobacterium LEGE 11480]|uniref:AhpC/TSA family protein n=1 Tax=Romeriopsis navalis LEGE 11480 TaxID=2777977 RepID=A0A928VNE2_9CYAN|nr:peroxiredoxin-like family protein [Romeriopsis navalis]MBE9029695.1 AhpC/TSA family protein [Romeriopsis navalis LEGE 11480]
MTAIATATTSAIRLVPGNVVPALTVDTLSGNAWSLAEQTPRNYTMVVFYRGLHCPLCADYLQQLTSKLSQFNELGIEVIAISGDSREKAATSAETWGVNDLTLGYGLTREAMQQWGLYVSKGAFDNEPNYFNEPGLFLIGPDGLLSFASVNNAPYGRTDLDTLLRGLDFVLNHNYPVRGTEV